MHDWCEVLAGKLALGKSVVMVTAIEVLGSAPCAPGAKLLVSDDGVSGTVGGGNLEFTAIEQARKLAASDRRSLLQTLPLGPILSQCCGGRVTLLLERFEPEEAGQFAKAAALGGHFITRVCPDSYVRRHRSVDLTNGAPLEQSCQLADDHWSEPVRQPRRQVVIFGGGHIGKALVQVLRQAPCELMVVDPRAEVAEDLASLAPVVPAASPEGLEEWWRPSSIAVILTHSHELDYLWTREILRRGDAGWCGLIGSKTKRARFLRRLRTDGVPETRIAELVCPIGLPGLNSKHPGVVAISTAAQLLPLLANLSHARAGQSCACALPGKDFTLETLQ